MLNQLPVQSDDTCCIYIEEISGEKYVQLFDEHLCQVVPQYSITSTVFPEFDITI